MTSLLNLPVSKHFELQPLADGVYAAIHRPGGAATCNTGIIDLGGLCLVFDAFQTPSAAEDLSRAARQLMGRDADIVIDSHYHGDHTWGNQAFPSTARIIASEATYRLMQTVGKEEFEHDVPGAAQTLAHFQKQRLEAQDEVKRKDAELFSGVYETLVADQPRMARRLPDITFNGRMAFHGATRSAELIAFDDCHTGNDAMLFLPEDGILFMGDLLFLDHHPFLGEGDPLNLLSTLKEIKQYPAKVYVSGHGPVGGPPELNLYISYLQTCIETAKRLVKEGKTDQEAINALPIPEPFRKWQLQFFYRGNMQALCARLAAG